MDNLLIKSYLKGVQLFFLVYSFRSICVIIINPAYRLYTCTLVDGLRIHSQDTHLSTADSGTTLCGINALINRLHTVSTENTSWQFNKAMLFILHEHLMVGGDNKILNYTKITNLSQGSTWTFKTTWLVKQKDTNFNCPDIKTTLVQTMHGTCISFFLL